MGTASGRYDRESPFASAAAPLAAIPLPAGAQGRSNREITGQDSVFVLEPGIAGDPRMVVRLEQVLRGDLGSDPMGELPDPFLLRLDHFVEKTLELVRRHGLQCSAGFRAGRDPASAPVPGAGLRSAEDRFARSGESGEGDQTIDLFRPPSFAAYRALSARYIS